MVRKAHATRDLLPISHSTSLDTTYSYIGTKDLVIYFSMTLRIGQWLAVLSVRFLQNHSRYIDCILHPIQVLSHSAMLSVITLQFSFFILGAILLFYKLRFRSSFPVEAPKSQSSLQSGRAQHAKAVVLRSKKGPYILIHNSPRPQFSSKEILIRNRAVGLNPIDWKCVAYGFGVHELPWISGRESAGVVEELGTDVNGFKIGDRVWVTSTNYRDNRTSTFQEVCTILFTSLLR